MVRILGIGLGSIWGAIALLGFWWAYSGFGANSRAEEATLTQKNLKQQILDAETAISKAKTSTGPSVPRGLSIIDAFQTQIARCAAKWGCSVNEFSAAPQLGAYLSRFAKDTPETDWQQVDVTATLRGQASNVVSLIRELADVGVPFEFNSIDLKPYDSNSKVAKVTCTMTLRLITRPEGV